MVGRVCAFVAAAVTLLTGSGCISCGEQGFATAYEIGPNCNVPTCQRNQVYVFAISGMNPTGLAALDSLREELSSQGFAKVCTGQSIFALWMDIQMREIYKEQPDAVFVILGSEGGASTAMRLAWKSKERGLPVAALVLLDAGGSTVIPEFGVRTLALGNGEGIASETASESIRIADAQSDTLPTHPRTISAVTQLLQEVAASTKPPTIEHVTAWWYPDAPAARPMVDSGPDGNWAFLFEQPGMVPRSIELDDGRDLARRPPSPYTSAIR